MKEFIEKLIGRLEEEKKQAQCEGSLSFAMGFKVAISIVNELAEEYSADTPQKSANGWIPCSERLPSENERWLGKDITDAEPREFIVMVKGAYEPTTGYYTVDGWVKDIYDKDNTSGYANEIIAWRFFPAPYRAEKAEWKDKVMKHFTNVE